MTKKLIDVSPQSNIEFNYESLELLMQGRCRSFECADFRANKCRMILFLNEIEKSEWEWSQTWHTPEKFFIHFLKHGTNADCEVRHTFEELQKKWTCLNSVESCNCEFFDELKKIYSALSENVA